MSEIKGHTPVPWQMWAEGNSVDIYERRSFGKGKFIASVPFQNPIDASADEPGANAQFIVKAVNNHERLLEALTLALPYVEMAIEDQVYKAGAVDRMVKKIKDAIKLAEGE